jgi:hypothetical protein
MRRELAERGRAAVQDQLRFWSREALGQTPLGKLVVAPT